MPTTILFVVNAPEFFVSHRLPVALNARNEGYDVHIASEMGVAVDQIVAHGFEHHVLKITRSGQNLIRELSVVVQLSLLFRKVKPDIVHLVTIKPVLYGGLAARLAGVPSVVAAVSGLGTVFLSKKGVARLRKVFVLALYRMAFQQKKLAVIFQNPDDRDMLMRVRAVKEPQVRMIRGSGVNLNKCRLEPEPPGQAVVTMAARLLRDKGIEEFVEAARLLKARGISARFRLIGSIDVGNPTSITPNQLAEWQREAVVELPGYLEDIPEQYVHSHIVCLPSYREGLPKSLVEAAACGRAVVTTDVPGCRDAIEPDITGVLVPVRDARALADAIQDLIENPERRRAMGIAGRELAEQVFAIEKIVEAHLAIYRELEANS